MKKQDKKEVKRIEYSLEEKIAYYESKIRYAQNRLISLKAEQYRNWQTLLVDKRKGRK